MQVDKNRNRPHVPPIWEDKTCFGRIHYFLFHRYGDEECLLAIVEFSKDWAPREFGIRECPAGWGSLKVVDIRCIRRVTGYVIRDKKWYLL